MYNNSWSPAISFQPNMYILKKWSWYKHGWWWPHPQNKYRRLEFHPGINMVMVATLISQLNYKWRTIFLWRSVSVGNFNSDKRLSKLIFPKVRANTFRHLQERVTSDLTNWLVYILSSVDFEGMASNWLSSMRLKGHLKYLPAKLKIWLLWSSSFEMPSRSSWRGFQHIPYPTSIVQTRYFSSSPEP